MWLLSTLFRINIILLLGIPNNDIAGALQCYVCGPRTASSCDNFNPSDTSFVQKCPPHARSCSTETHGNSIERSCEDMELHDCQTANDIRYCYCSENLCNGRVDTFSDDEDLTHEGSGTTVIQSNVIPEQKSNTISQPSFVQFYLYSACIPLLAILFN